MSRKYIKIKSLIVVIHDCALLFSIFVGKYMYLLKLVFVDQIQLYNNRFYSWKNIFFKLAIMCYQYQSYSKLIRITNIYFKVP